MASTFRLRFPLLFDRQVFAWALYDWANSAFATTVMAGFFPLFFKQYFNHGVAATVSTDRLGLSNTAAGLCVLAVGPILAAIADARAARTRFLGAFTLLGVLATGLIAALPQHSWFAAAALYVAAVIGFQGALIFYDSFLPLLSANRSADAISCFGYGMGYLGGGLLFLLNVLMFLQPQFFGLADGTAAVKASFVVVAVWWACFSLPLLRYAPVSLASLPPSAAPFSSAGVLKTAFRELITTIRRIAGDRQIAIFLLAYWIYIDGVNTIVKMSVDYGAALGLESRHLITALLMTQFVGFPSAIAFSALGSRLGTTRAIAAGLVVYLAATCWAMGMTQAWEFYALAATIGLVQGGVQALSRSYFSRLVREEDAAQYFSLFNLVGKFATLLGPLAVGLVSRYSGSSRLGILPVAVLFLIGLVLLLRSSAEERNEPRSPY